MVRPCLLKLYSNYIVYSKDYRLIEIIYSLFTVYLIGGEWFVIIYCVENCFPVGVFDSSWLLSLRSLFAVIHHFWNTFNWSLVVQNQSHSYILQCHVCYCKRLKALYLMSLGQLMLHGTSMKVQRSTNLKHQEWDTNTQCDVCRG